MAKLPKFSVKKSGSIRGWSEEVAKLTKEPDVRQVVSKLKFEHLDPMASEMRIASSASVRLDRQGNVSGGGANLQVQLNDPQKHGLSRSAKTTVAQVVVGSQDFEKAAECREKNVREHLASVTRSALLKSYGAKGPAYKVVGSS